MKTVGNTANANRRNLKPIEFSLISRIKKLNRGAKKLNPSAGTCVLLSTHLLGLLV